MVAKNLPALPDDNYAKQSLSDGISYRAEAELLALSSAPLQVAVNLPVPLLLPPLMARTAPADSYKSSHGGTKARAKNGYSGTGWTTPQ